MSRIGTVQELKGKYAIISSLRRGICEGCSDKSSCSFDNALGKSVPDIIIAINSVKAAPGDRVEFELSGHTELKTSLIVWVIPLIGLILGAATGSYFHKVLGLSADIATLCGLVLGLAIGFGSVVFYERFIVDKEGTLPILVKVIPGQVCGNGS